MSNGKVSQSFGAATLKAREVKNNFVRATTSNCSSENPKDVEVHQNDKLNRSTVQP